jgi:hypothetical protein
MKPEIDLVVAHPCTGRAPERPTAPQPPVGAVQA